jgi:hypothetical protein
MLNAFVMVSQVAGVLILIDFLSGVFHWIEDSYGSEMTPVFGRLVVIPNNIHHRQPRDFVRSAFWHRNIITFILCLSLSISYVLLFGASWRLYLFCGLGAFCNEYHCWAHRSAVENGKLITALHRLRLIQTPRHHAIHHTDPKNRAYCVFTNLINPALDKIEFWRRLEAGVALILRVHPRPDASLNHQVAVAS